MQSKAEARRPGRSFVELAPTTASAPAPSTAGASCEIVIADIVLRIGSDLTASLACRRPVSSPRELQIVVENRKRNAAEKSEGRDMAMEKGSVVSAA